jgi:hypothetical protein
MNRDPQHASLGCVIDRDIKNRARLQRAGDHPANLPVVFL